MVDRGRYMTSKERVRLQQQHDKEEQSRITQLLKKLGLVRQEKDAKKDG
jgi:predicted membrane GTPase involved in stress response